MLQFLLELTRRVVPCAEEAKSACVGDARGEETARGVCHWREDYWVLEFGEEGVQRGAERERRHAGRLSWVQSWVSGTVGSDAKGNRVLSLPSLVGYQSDTALVCVFSGRQRRRLSAAAFGLSSRPMLPAEVEEPHGRSSKSESLRSGLELTQS